MPADLQIAQPPLVRRESFRVSMAFVVNIVVFCGIVFPLMLTSLPLVLKLVLMVYPTASIANWAARVATGIDLQARWFK